MTATDALVVVLLVLSLGLGALGATALTALRDLVLRWWRRRHPGPDDA